MVSTITKIITIGNSKGLRLSRAYLDRLGIETGETVEVTLKKIKPNSKQALQTLREIAAMNGPLSKIDVNKWEAERKADYQKREKQYRDILGR